MEPPPTPPLIVQEIVDAEHLRLLEIFHYVLGGIIILFSSLFLMHVFLGLTLAVNPQFLRDAAAANRRPFPVARSPIISSAPSPTPFRNFSPDTPPADQAAPSSTPFRNFSPDTQALPPQFGQFPPAFGYMIAGMGAVMVLGGWTVGALNLWSGWSIRRRQGRIFSFVVAAVDCLFFPFGTVLGVFSLVVLSRSTVARMYDRASLVAAGVPPLPGSFA